MTFNDDVQGVWFVSTKDPAGDWLCALSRAPAGVMVEFRFRFFRSDGPDEQHWGTIQQRGLDIEGAVTLVREMAARVAQSGGRTSELLRGARPLHEFLDELLTQPFVSELFAR